ncbi:MAG TPA: hypothetical protein EYQ83_01970 [Acidobacteria bacterium]|nr:hypothetical protein [Acidobacteriota bacterium]
MSRLHDALGARREREWRRPREAPWSLDQLGWTPSPQSRLRRLTRRLGVIRLGLLVGGLLWVIWWVVGVLQP